MKLITSKMNKGFALLFSVLLASILLSIGLSIFNITLKELAISTGARQSIHAFYSADSGREYVIYQDIKEGNAVGKPTDDNVESKDYTQLDTWPYYSVTIRKQRSGVSGGLTCDDTKEFCVEIKAKGYDADNTTDDRLERAIEQIY